MIDDVELKRRVIAAHNLRRWYQKMPFYNFEWPVLTHFEDGKTDPRSFGEGRWSNYIRPAIQAISQELDTPNATMCEVGCSAGLFLLKAWKEFNFKRLIGVEGANAQYEQLLITQDYWDTMPLFTYHAGIGQLEKNIYDPRISPLNMNTHPIADVTLMSCVHYHIQESDLVSYLKHLVSKSLYLIILTDENAGHVTNPTSAYFDNVILKGVPGWEGVTEVRTPRRWLAHKVKARVKDITVLVYRSKVLKRFSAKECFEKQLNWHSGRGGKHEDWYAFAQEFYKDIFPQFIDDVLAGKTTLWNYTASKCYEWQHRPYHGSTAWLPNIAANRTMSYVQMVQTMQHHGQEQPIELQEHLSTVDPWDGWHRVAIANHLGIKYVYGKDA